MDAGLTGPAVFVARMPAWYHTGTGAEAYASFADKAAALMHSLARNHSLVDGSQRLAWSATRTMCLLNGHDLRYDIDEAEAFVVGVAAGDLGVPAIAEWIALHLTTAS